MIAPVPKIKPRPHHPRTIVIFPPAVKPPDPQTMSGSQNPRLTISGCEPHAPRTRTSFKFMFSTSVLRGASFPPSVMLFARPLSGADRIHDAIFRTLYRKRSLQTRKKQTKTNTKNNDHVLFFRRIDAMAGNLESSKNKPPSLQRLPDARTGGHCALRRDEGTIAIQRTARLLSCSLTSHPHPLAKPRASCTASPSLLGHPPSHAQPPRCRSSRHPRVRPHRLPCRGIFFPFSPRHCLDPSGSRRARRTRSSTTRTASTTRATRRTPRRPG